MRYPCRWEQEGEMGESSNGDGWTAPGVTTDRDAWWLRPLTAAALIGITGVVLGTGGILLGIAVGLWRWILGV